MKNRTLPLLCLSAGLAHFAQVAPANAQTAPLPPTAPAPINPGRANLPTVTPPSVTPTPFRPAPTTPAGLPARPGTALGGTGDTGVALGRDLPDRPAPELQGLEPQPGGLTANEVARRALAVSASVRQKAEEVVAANEKITQTTVSFLPKLTLLASYLRTSKVDASFGGGGNLVGTTRPEGPTITNTNQLISIPVAFNFPQNNYTLTARLSIPLSDYVLRVSDASGATKASKISAQLLVEAEKLKVMNDAKALYYNWLRAWAQVAIAKNAVESTQARLNDARASFSVGSISRADLLRIEALVANTQLVLDQAQSALNLTTGQLAIIMEDWHPSYKIGEGIPDPSTIADADASVDRLVAEAHSRRLEIHSVDEAVRALHYGVSAAHAGSWPHIDAVGDITYANPNPRYFPPSQDWHTSWSAGAQASWTFGDTLTQESQAREYEANERSMIAQRRLVRAGIANEVLGSFLDLSRARSALDRQRIALASAEEAYRVTTDLFRAGRATGTDLINSEQELLIAKVGEVNARIDLAIAAVTLRHATGRDAPDAKQVAKN
jgi:outer membrane protein TolC